MNAPDKLNLELNDKLALTREPFPASRKTYLIGSRPDVRVPVREVALSNGEQIALYDTSGPYTDPNAVIDVHRGLPEVRSAWIDARGDTETYEGRSRQALDDGVKHEARDPERIEQLRAAAAALQRTPRRCCCRCRLSDRTNC